MSVQMAKRDWPGLMLMPVVPSFRTICFGSTCIIGKKVDGSCTCITMGRCSEFLVGLGAS